MSMFILLFAIPMILAIYAQIKVSSTYSHWSKVESQRKMTGRDAAAAILKGAGIHHVTIEETEGHLTDHYDPSNKRLVLSSENYQGSHLAALGVAAHEAGHAIQHQEKYAPLQFRMSLIPITNIASNILPFVVFGGLFMGLLGLVKLGIVVYLILTVFQLITLPVEFDASRRAKKQLLQLGILDHSEIPGVVATLNAAGLTYLAAFVATLANLLFFILASRNED